MNDRRNEFGNKEWFESEVVHYPLNKYVLCVLSFFYDPGIVCFLFVIAYCHTAWYIIDTSPGRVSSRRVVMKDSPELHCHRSGFISKEEEWTKKKSRH